MPTQTSQLVQNLTAIYNEKLLIKAAIPTTSDDFMQYHTYISNLHPSGTSYISANGLSDVSSYQFAYVTVEGGGSSSSADPYYDVKLIVEDMIMAGETTADYVLTNLDENFSVTMALDGESIDLVEWDFYMDVPTGEIDPQTGSDIMERKTFHVIVSSNDEHGVLWTATNIKTALKDYPDLYENINPTLENATLTESEDPSEDGYDYLLEGDIYAWNLKDNIENVEEITESGFYPTNGALGFDVNINTGITPSGTSYITTNGSHDVTSYATAYVDVQSGGSSSDPKYDALTMEDVIKEGLTSAKYLRIPIDDNFDFRGLQNAPYAMWEANITYWDNNLDDNVDVLVIVSIESDNCSVLDDNGARLATAFDDYPELYGTVQPVLEDVTIEFVQKTSGDYYSVTGGIHYVCTPISVVDVRVIDKNGVYPTTEGIGIEVAVPQELILPKANIGSLDDVAGNPETPRNIIISTSSANWVDTADFISDKLIQNSDVYNYINSMSNNSFICEIDETDSNSNHYYILADSQGSEDPDWLLVEMTECGIVNDSRLGHYAYILNGSVTNFRDI